MASDPDCLFCKIISGDVPAEVVHESARTVAFRDVNPQAPTHILVIPRAHEPDLASLVAADSESVVAINAAVAEIARAEQLHTGYRIVFNTGVGAGQTVFHCHAHLLGGRTFGWPPG